MNRIVVLLIAFLLSSFVNFAQQGSKTTKKSTTTKTVTSKSVNPTKGIVLKKDGTPDKRYKSKAAVPLKKDGTPDKRYKGNKRG